MAIRFYLHLKEIKKEFMDREAETKDQFYEIVHELRAPLTAMKDASLLLSDNSGNLSPDEQSKMLSLIKNECLKLLDQVSGFLDTSKVMSNKMTVQKEPNDLKKLLEEKCIMFNAQAAAANITLNKEIDEFMPTVMYDARLMNQVMNNLISNSLKYTPSGGTITISGKTSDSAVTVAVYDNGMGIPDEKQKELFTKFASMNSKDSAVASSGLGLYVVKGIVEAHGGKVTVETHHGRGYKISLTLPLSAVPASIEQAVPATVTGPTNPPPTSNVQQ